MATRKAGDEKPTGDFTPPAANRSAIPVLMWINDSPVRVEIVETPIGHPRDGVCRCQACGASPAADSAAHFI